MDLGKWLRDRKKQLEGVQAQVNPFDNGKTYATTTRKPAVNPFQSNNVNARYGVLADKNRRDQFVQDNQPSYTTPIASFESLKQAPGRLGSNLINNPVTTKLADITGADRQKSVDNRNSSDYLKPNSVIENVVAAGSNLGRFNPINQLGEIGQYVDTATDKTFLKNQGNKIGKATKPLTKFGTPDQGSVWASENLDNRIARESGNFATMLGQTANYASPVAGPIAMGGTISSEANDIVQQARAKGQNELIANLKGLASGGVQAAVERYSSKLTTGLPGASQIGKLTTNRLAKVPASLIGGGLVEGAEEFTQGLTGNIARGNKWNEGLKDQTIAGAKGGVMLGGFFGGANALSNKSQGVQQEVTQQVEQQNPQLQQTGIPAQPGSIRERIQRAKENVKSNIVNSQLAQNEGGYVMNPFYKDGTLKPGLDKNKVFEGVDGKPRYEVSDEGAKINLQDSPSGRKSFYTTDQLKSGKDATLSQVLDHPKLYEQYPGLKDLRIQSIDFYKDARSQAAYDSSTKTLNVSNELLNNPQELKEAILHEVQHSIQDIEGFAKGGSIQGEDVAGYNNLAGEAEARAVASRMDMPMSERYVKPHQTLDEFEKSLNLMKWGKVTGVGQLPISKLSKAQMKVLLKDGLPENGGHLKVSDFKKGRKVTQPIEVSQRGSSYVVENGRHRLFQALANGDESVPVVFKSGEGKAHSLPIEEFYNKAKPQSTFYDSLDVPKEDLIIRSGDGKAMSVDKKQEVKTPKVSKNTELAQKQAQSIEKLKKEGKITPKDENYWSTPIKGEPKAPIPNVKDTNGLTPMEGDKIEFDSILGDKGGKTKKGTATVRWSEPSIANASGKRVEGSWIGNGKLDNGQPFTIIERADGSTPQTAKITPTKKPFKPLSTPEDTTPAIAKQVTKLTPEAYAETFGVSQEQAKKDTASLNPPKTNPLDSVGMTEQEATKKLESNAPTMSPGNKKTKTLVDSMINDKKLTEAARIAQKEGKELNYFAKKDPNGRSVGVEEYNPSRQRIEAGFVVDNTTGKILGNHIKVDPSGIQVNVGGEIVNVEQIIGNPLDWKGNYEVSSTMERNIFKNAPTEEIAQKTYKFLIANKIKAESELKQDLEKTRKDLTARVKTVTDAKPKTVKSDDYKADIFDYIEDKKSQADIASKYGPKASAAITEYKKQTRQLYDTLLERVNKEFAKFGEKEIPKRKDYITHINELNQQPNFAGELMGQLQNSIMGEGNQTTRGQIPGSIAGRTETFAPRKRWNPFAQQRKGGEFTKDPFTVVDKYLEPTLYNIHMTESAVRARAVESAFRTADEIRQSDASKIKNELGTELAKYAKDSKNGRLVAGFQEYANALAGKTQRLDRQIIDMSQATNTALRGWQGLQRIGGRATILGNVNSMLMQPLNQISTLADTDISSYVKGIARSMGNSDASELSPFIKARETKAESSFKGIGEKFMDKLGVPMGAIELASVKLAWNAEYEQVLKEGLKGNDAVIEADRRTERVVAGRGIADKPEVYRSTALNGLFQYTLEVSAQNKKFFKDFTPTQKAKFVAGAFAANQLYGLVTGNEPLPDYLDAAIQSLKDWFGDDDETKGEKAVQTGQRFLSETVKFNPFVSSAANVLSKDTRKKIFGSESDLARYDGAPAPIGVIKNTIDAVSKASSGDMKGARDSALKNIPAGNQIRKTLQGKELIQDGAKVDKNGKKLYVAPENPLGKLQALLFGPSATKTAREYFDKGTNATGGGNATKKDASGKTIDDFKTIAEASFNDAKGREFIALENDEARKDFARQSPENKALYDQYKSMQKAFNGGDKLLPSGLDKNSEKILQKYDRLEPKAREDIFNRQNDAEYQYELAKYEKDKLEGTISQVDAIRKEKTLAKMQVGSKYEKGIRDVYSLTKNQIKDLVEGSPEGQAIYDKLVKYDQELYDAGLISYRKFKNGLGSGKGGRGGRGKKDTSLSDFYSLQSSTNKKLRQLLASSEFKGGAKSPGPKAKQAAQKKISVNMKA